MGKAGLDVQTQFVSVWLPGTCHRTATLMVIMMMMMVITMMMMVMMMLVAAYNDNNIANATRQDKTLSIFNVVRS